MFFLIGDSASEANDNANEGRGSLENDAETQKPSRQEFLDKHDHFQESHYPDENDLALQAKKGDIPAFENLYKRYYNRICLYLLHLVGDDGIACELTQETFFKAWRSLPSLRETTKFSGWLYRIATNLAYDHKRSVKNEKFECCDQIEDIEEISTAGPEELVEIKERTQMALSQVSWRYRACLVLYHIQGLSKQKIAEILEIQESSVGPYVSTGLALFRQIYRNLSIEHSAPGREE